MLIQPWVEREAIYHLLAGTCESKTINELNAACEHCQNAVISRHNILHGFDDFGFRLRLTDRPECLDYMGRCRRGVCIPLPH